MNQLRNKIFQDQQQVASKSRFGLFSQPPPLAIGDDSPYKTKQHKLDPQTSKPKTQPRNMLAGITPIKKSDKKTKNIDKKDPYIDTFRRQLQYQNAMHRKSANQDNQFKPASGYKQLIKSSYQYKQQKPKNAKRIDKNQNGRVKTQPPNITSNPMSKIARQYFKCPAYKLDERKKLQEGQIKQLINKNQEAVFILMNHGCKNFTRDKIIYGIDNQSKTMIDKKKIFVSKAVRQYPHESAFKLARKGHGDTISPFPKDIEAKSPLFSKKRSRLVTTPSERQTWKPSVHNPLSRPTPSISLMNKKTICYRFR